MHRPWENVWSSRVRGYILNDDLNLKIIDEVLNVHPSTVSKRGKAKEVIQKKRYSGSPTCWSQGTSKEVLWLMKCFFNVKKKMLPPNNSRQWKVDLLRETQEILFVPRLITFIDINNHFEERHPRIKSNALHLVGRTKGYYKLLQPGKTLLNVPAWQYSASRTTWKSFAWISYPTRCTP